MVFLLVLATNKMDSSHFTIVQNSLSTVYEDRLLVKDYIYRISRQLQLKKELVDSNTPQASKISGVTSDSIEVLINKFLDTKLTESEARYLTSLQNKLDQLHQYERNVGENRSNSAEAPAPGEVETFFDKIFEDLDALSKIQLQESKREIIRSNRMIETNNLISRLEIGALIVIGVLVQLLLFFKPLK